MTCGHTSCLRSPSARFSHVCYPCLRHRGGDARHRAASPCQSIRSWTHDAGLLSLALAGPLSSGDSWVRLKQCSLLLTTGSQPRRFYPPGQLATSGDIYGCHSWRCPWNLAGRGQGCGSVSYTGQAPQLRLTGPRRQGAEVGNSALGLARAPGDRRRRIQPCGCVGRGRARGLWDLMRRVCQRQSGGVPGEQGRWRRWGPGSLLRMAVGALRQLVLLSAMDHGGWAPASDTCPTTPFMTSGLALGHPGCSKNPSTRVVPRTASIRL